MKVLQVVYEYDKGGAEKLLHDSIPLFNEHFQTDLLVFKPGGIYFSEFYSKNTSAKLYHFTLWEYFFKRKFIKNLIQEYSLIHVHLFPALYIIPILFLYLGLKIPLVFTEHSNHNRRRNYKQILFLERFIYKKYKTIICISNEVKRTLLEHLKISVNCVVVYNGIDLEKFKTRPLVCPFEKEPGEISLVQVARFRPEKDQKTCIYAMELLPKNYKLYFIGDGPTMEEHILLVKNLSLENRVIFMGAIDKIEKFLPYFDIGIISSHWEGFGLAAVEYMAAGIITIVGDIPSLSEITSNSAVSFKYKCGVDLSNKIISVINNNFIKEQMIISGPKRAQNFKIENNIKKSISLYQSI